MLNCGLLTSNSKSAKKLYFSYTAKNMSSVACPWGGNPPVQMVKGLTSPGNQFSYDFVASFCTPMTLKELTAAAPGTYVSAAKLQENCLNVKKLTSADQKIYGYVNNPVSDDCDHILSSISALSRSQATLIQTFNGQSTVVVNMQCSESGNADLWQASGSKGNTATPAYTINAQWKAACNGVSFGSSASESGGGVFGIAIIIILLVGIVLYIVGMVVFNKFVKKKEGRDIAPHPDFWSAVPGYIKDGHKFVFAKVTGKGQQTEYSSA